MATFLQRIRTAIIQRFPWERLVTPGRLLCVHFLVHAAARHTPLHLAGLYDVKSPERLHSELKELKQRYEFIDTWDYITRLNNGGPTGRRPLATLTCDDGLVEFANAVWPVLCDLSIPCTLFVVKRFVTQGQVMYRFKTALAVSWLRQRRSASGDREERLLIDRECERLLAIHDPRDHHLIDGIAAENGLDLDVYFGKNRRLYLEADELVALQKEGLRLGSHGVAHHPGRFLTSAMIEADINEGVDYVANLSGQKAVEHAFPFNAAGLSIKLLRGILHRNPKITHFFDTGRSFRMYPEVSGRMPIDMMTPKQALRRYGFKTLQETIFPVRWI